MQVSELLGGIEHVRDCIVTALKQRRMEMDITCAELDHFCGLGGDLPSFEKVEEDPQLLNSAIISRVLCGLGLGIDEVLPLKGLTKAIMARLAVDMERNARAVLSFAGTREKGGFDSKGMVRLYAQLKVLQEL